jgi:hypothetical protein
MDCALQSTFISPSEREITFEVRKLNLNDYETFHYDKERLKEVCKSIDLPAN